MSTAEWAACFERRAHLHTQGTTVYRAIHTSETGGRFALDVAGSVGILNLYDSLTPSAELRLAQACGEAGGLTGVYLKRRPREAKHLANVERDWLSPPEPIWGEAQPELTALEHGIPYLIRPGADLSVGLFTDARPARTWVRENAHGRVLNTFAYTCAFGVNAALGGAQVVKNVDLSRKVLAWGQDNYQLSGLNAPDLDFLYGDVFEWLARLRKRGDEFDLVVLDPPSFARSRGHTWQAEKDYGRLVTLAAQVAAPHGRLMTLLNHAGVTAEGLERMVQAGLHASGRRGTVKLRLGAGEDYPQATHLKVQVWQLL